MPSVPADLHERLRHYQQEHVLAWWDQLTEAQQTSLLDQVQALDLDQLCRLYGERDHAYPLPAPETITPIPVVQLGEIAKDDVRSKHIRELGETALRRGEVAALVVAGGQGSRLG